MSIITPLDFSCNYFTLKIQFVESCSTFIIVARISQMLLSHASYLSLTASMKDWNSSRVQYGLLSTCDFPINPALLFFANV